MHRIQVDFVKTCPNAKTPFRAHEGDAGYDLFTVKDVLLEPGVPQDVPTGIRMELPVGFWARITGRSSTIRKHKILVNEGIIDQGYTGELFVLCINLGEPIRIPAGTRLAQLIPHPLVNTDWQEVTSLNETSRGQKGFGSSGE